MDGRTARVKRSKHRIITACRAAMCAGIFQPSVVDIAKAAEISVRSVFQHFAGIKALHQEAIEDPATEQAILLALTGMEYYFPAPIARRIVVATVLGRTAIGGHDEH